MLFVHLPLHTPLLPITLLLPLSSPSPLSLTALPTPPSPILTTLNAPFTSAPNLGATPASMTSPQHAMDDLVATLVVGMPEAGPSPGMVAGALGLGRGGLKEEGGGAGTDALEEELRKAEAGRRGGAEGEVRMAAVGVARSLLRECKA